MSISDKLPFKTDLVSIALFAAAVVAVIVLVRKIPGVPAAIKP